ncbi:MAG TPA: hypothetical protein VGN16_10080 [Acidobacteriaceae bacterium]|jgi:hypothetical protein
MSSQRTGDWSTARLIAFRFVCCYLIAYNIPQQGSASIFDILPWGNGPLNEWFSKPLQPVAVWLGRHLFHITGEGATFHPTGSGDTAMNYVLVFICLCLAVLGTLIWSLLDRKRKQYRIASAWLRLFVSFVVAESLVEYGFAKVFPDQFGRLYIMRLNETYGESSPMALLWTFMAGSRWYTMFGGFAEIIPGILLFFRRTRTLGALLGTAVLFNVVMLNFCYDVPVKLYSSHLVLMCLFLLAPDVMALLRLFVLRGQAQLKTDHVPASERRWLRLTGYVALGLIVVCTLLSVGVGAYSPYPDPEPMQAPLYGHWHVDHADATTALTAWSDIYIDGRGGPMIVRQVDGKRIRVNITLNGLQHSVATISPKYGNNTLHYSADAEEMPHHVTIDGPFNQGQIHLELSRRSPDQYSLLTQGFHWIHEDPPNW